MFFGKHKAKVEGVFAEEFSFIHLASLYFVLQGFVDEVSELPRIFFDDFLPCSSQAGKLGVIRSFLGAGEGEVEACRSGDGRWILGHRGKSLLVASEFVRCREH